MSLDNNREIVEKKMPFIICMCFDVLIIGISNTPKLCDEDLRNICHINATGSLDSFISVTVFT